MSEEYKKNEPTTENIETYRKEMAKFLGEYLFELETPEYSEEESVKRTYISKAGTTEENIEKNASIDILKSPDRLDMFFEEMGFKGTKPVSVVNADGTTLYISSGVQILDPMIHLELKIPDEKIFVSQPVIRAQFIDSVENNTSTSFINLSTESINNGMADHFDNVRAWFSLLRLIGIQPSKIVIVEKCTTQRWGKRKFENFVLKFFYKNLEIGDAVYIPTMPQDSRPAISISDVGFGVERLNAVAKNSLYFREIVNNNIELFSIDNKTLDYIRTLTLIASSGVEPSNNDHGYRFRLFAKRLVSIIHGSKIEVIKLIEFFFEEWNKWGTLSVDKEKTIILIIKEMERNLNRLILDEVNKTHKLTGIDINRSTEDLWTALRNSGIAEDEISSLKKKYNIIL